MTAWAFIVGINDYQSHSGLKPLRGAVADAADFADWALADDGGGVSSDHLFLWTCPAPAAEALPNLTAYLATPPTHWPVRPDWTRPPAAYEINPTIQYVAQQAQKSGASRLYVFLAGHGLQTRQENHLEDAQTCFVAGNFGPGSETSGLIPCDEMRRMLQAQGPAELVVFIDACRTKASIRVTKPTGGWDAAPNRGQHRRMGIARGAQLYEVAYEVPFDAPSRGAFSTLLVSGLRSHRKNGQLTFQDLDQYVSTGIGSVVSPEIQVPDFIEQPRPWGLVLARNLTDAVHAKVVITFTAETIGSKVRLLGGPDAIDHQLIGSEQAQSLNLAPGAYAIELEGGQRDLAFHHTGAGDTHVSF